ncbi:MAG: hypothetical protein J6T10_21175 [Methanobrevibacter sp.]|nr:hypothetical protein [Methanobrevibacter sp.]
MTKLYVVFTANQDDIIISVFPTAYKVWTNATRVCDNRQRFINDWDNWRVTTRNTRRVGILTIDSSLTNGRTQGTILNQFIGHNYNEYNL